MHRNSQKLHIFTKIFFAFLFLIVVTVSVLLFRNSLQIHNFIEWRTSVYLTDVTYQIVDKVNGRIEQSVETLRMLRDSAILFESPQVESFLERKKTFAGYDDLLPVFHALRRQKSGWRRLIPVFIWIQKWR